MMKVMRATPFTDAQIIESWIDNAGPWTAAVREKRIESRVRVTDRAIIDVVLAHAPGSVLDVGCGEGWLARELSARGIEVVGIDAVAQLIDQARGAGAGDFRVMSYDDIASGALTIRVGALLCNFSLIGHQSVDRLIRNCAKLLNADGALIVQTLHPLEACGDEACVDGWRAGSWSGFGTEFRNPAPWYFRTLESWRALFAQAGFRSVDTHEPIHPDTRRPASVIFVARNAELDQQGEMP